MIASPDLTDKLLQSYAFTAKDKQALANSLAQGYLLAKAQSYNRAQTSVGAIVLIRHPWVVGPSDVKKAQSWATQQVEGIATTYETLLRHAIEDMPVERSIGDIVGGIKQVIANIGDWITGFLPWKTQQIADSTWAEGDSDGTSEWIDDASDPDGIDGIITNIKVRVIPETSSKDACELIAGETFELQDAPKNLPMHTNCIHYLEVISVS
jgi:hypothetical protein